MGFGQPTNLFKECKQLDNWNRIPAPPFAIKYNGELTDKISKQTKDGAKLVLLLKAASVIGQNFTLAQLIAANPVRKENKDQIEKYIYFLEDQSEFQGNTPIQIMDDTANHGLLMRFIKPFHKEVIYQRMLYNEQRKPIHIICSKYLQENQSIQFNLQTECKRLIWHILASEDLETQEELSSRARQKVTIKKVQNLLLSGAKVIKTGLLTKEGQKAGKNIEKRYIILTPTEFQYFHSQQESRTIKYPLGTIYLQSIYGIMNAKRSLSTADFFIGAGRWKKKNKDKQQRQFVFGAKDDDQKDDWITTIKLLRARAVHKGFQSKFGKLNINDLDKKNKTPVSPSNELFRQKSNLLNASFATGLNSSDSSILPFKRSKTNKFRRDSQLSITSSIKDKRKQSSFNKKIRSTNAFKQSQQVGSIASQQADSKLKQSIIDLFGFALSDLFGSIGCNTVTPRSTKIGKYKQMLSGSNNSVIQLHYLYRPSLMSNSEQITESRTQIKGSFSSETNYKNTGSGYKIIPNIITSNNSSLNLSINQIQSPTKISGGAEEAFIQPKISRKLTTIEQDQLNQEKERKNIRPKTFKPPQKILRRSLTTAGNNPSVQSFKFDMAKANNIHGNSSHRYDKASVTPTAISSIQNYPTNTPDMTMDRSFSPISGIDIQTVGESRKSSNIASAVVFQQSESDINFQKKELKRQANRQEQQQSLEYDGYSSREDANSRHSISQSLTLLVQKYDELNEISPKIVDWKGEQVLYSKSINNKIQTVQKINSKLIVQEVVTKQQKSIHRPNVSMFTFETILQRSLRLNQSSRNMINKDDYSSISPSSAIQTSHNRDVILGSSMSNIRSRPILSSRLTNSSFPLPIQNISKSGIIHGLANDNAEDKIFDQTIKQFEEERKFIRHHKEPSNRYPENDQNDSQEIFEQNSINKSKKSEIPAKKRYPTFQQSNFQEQHLFFKGTEIPQFNAMFPNKQDMDSNGDQKLLVQAQDLRSLKQSQKVSPRFNKFTNLQSLEQITQDQQNYLKKPLRVSNFPHNNILLGSGSVRVSQGDVEDNTLKTIPSLQIQNSPKHQKIKQQFLQDQKSELNKFKQKFKAKQEKRRQSTRQIQNQQKNKQKQIKIKSEAQQFISIYKISQTGVNDSKVLNSQMQNKVRQEKQYIVALKASSALNNSQL